MKSSSIICFKKKKKVKYNNISFVFLFLFSHCYLIWCYLVWITVMFLFLMYFSGCCLMQTQWIIRTIKSPATKQIMTYKENISSVYANILSSLAVSMNCFCIFFLASDSNLFTESDAQALKLLSPMQPIMPVIRSIILTFNNNGKLNEQFNIYWNSFNWLKSEVILKIKDGFCN